MLSRISRGTLRRNAVDASERFRQATRDWLAGNCPPGARGPGPVPWGSRKLPLAPDASLWLARMAARGWTAPTWPRRYGGAGLDKARYAILIEELRRIGARAPLAGRGVYYIGPTLLEFGSEEQKARWLPGIARGDGGWAMGYSEPGAGSDLASLSLRAMRDGDRYVLNGRKIWTSDAEHADYIFVLARTAPDKPKREGISLLLVEMDQPGVQVRPIRLISGASPFSETLFEDAEACAADVVGGVDNGWAVGKRLLQFERSTHAGINISGLSGAGAASTLPEAIKPYADFDGDRIRDGALRERLLDHELAHHALRLTRQRVIEETAARAPGFASSAVKAASAVTAQRGDELLLDALGSDALAWDGGAARKWLRNRALTIAGGTREIQLDIIAKRILGLPG